MPADGMEFCFCFARAYECVLSLCRSVGGINAQHINANFMNARFDITRLLHRSLIVGSWRRCSLVELDFFIYI